MTMLPLNLEQIKHSIKMAFTTQCQCCGLPRNNHDLFCQYCQDSIITSVSCIGCGKALPLKENSSILCGYCQQNPPSYNRLITLGSYEFPLNHLVGRFKYHQKQVLAEPLALLLAKEITRRYNTEKTHFPDLIIPVPLHFKRELSRGFNQSELIAKVLAKKLNIPMSQNHLFRSISTPAQASLTRKQRLKNLANAFECQTLKGLHIALVDDVVTTGATASQITKCLKKSGAVEVDIWCICRTEF